MKTFNTLLKSEVKKIEKEANRITGFNNCKLTGYSAKRDGDFVEIEAEICRNYEDRVYGIEVRMSVFMLDRRMSKAWGYVTGEIFTI